MWVGHKMRRTLCVCVCVCVCLCLCVRACVSMHACVCAVHFISNFCPKALLHHLCVVLVNRVWHSWLPNCSGQVNSVVGQVKKLASCPTRQVKILGFVFPLSTASCERGLPIMTGMKTDWRSRLNTSTMSKLMYISTEEPSVKEYNCMLTLQRWWEESQGRRPQQWLAWFSSLDWNWVSWCWKVLQVVKQTDCCHHNTWGTALSQRTSVVAFSSEKMAMKNKSKRKNAELIGNLSL